MTEVRFLPPAAKFLKKCKDKKLKLLYRQAIDKIKEDHTIGEAKNGDLSGIYGYDIYYNKTNYELAYRVEYIDNKIISSISLYPLLIYNISYSIKLYKIINL